MRLFPRIGKNWSNFFLVLYIFDFISTNWKIFYQCLLFPQSRKNESDFLYTFIFLFLFTETGKFPTNWRKLQWFILLLKGKKYQRDKLQNVFIYFHEVEKWTSFPYFYTHLILFPKCCTITFFCTKHRNFDWVF